MAPETNSNPVPGWVGGFAQSNSAFPYPNPDLSSLKMLGNLDNIDLLQRQQPVKWPEFSWNTQPGQKDPKRCFQMFAPYISRLGYTNEGRVYSIICPQQGVWFPTLGGTMNVEVTVSGQRGWVDESETAVENDKSMAADMTVHGTIWFSPSGQQNPLGKLVWDFAKLSGLPFPLSKEKAIIVTTHLPGNPDQPIFPIRSGVTKEFDSPTFAQHWNDGAWNVANLGVEIGPINKTGYAVVDGFNQLVMDLFNLGSGNMLLDGNTLTWNVWFTAPVYVNQEEWRTHAERWRRSIDEEHRSPDGDGSDARFANGEVFNPIKSAIDQKIQEIIKWLWDYFMGNKQTLLANAPKSGMLAAESTAPDLEQDFAEAQAWIEQNLNTVSEEKLV